MLTFCTWPVSIDDLGQGHILVRYSGSKPRPGWHVSMTSVTQCMVYSVAFFSQNSSALTVAHCLGGMTMSGLHCVMTSGYSTVAGVLLGLYVLFGIPPSYPIAATVMSAPAALAVGKIFYPEKDRSQLKRSAEVVLSEGYVISLYFSIRMQF